MKIQRYEARDHRLEVHDFSVESEYEQTRPVALFIDNIHCAGVAVTLNEALERQGILGPEILKTGFRS